MAADRFIDRPQQTRGMTETCTFFRSPQRWGLALPKRRVQTPVTPPDLGCDRLSSRLGGEVEVIKGATAEGIAAEVEAGAGPEVGPAHA